MPTSYEMSDKEAEEFLRNGGTFEALGGALKVGYDNRFSRYLLVNETGNGGEYIQSRYATMQDLMEQLAGSLEAWQGVEPDN